MTAAFNPAHIAPGNESVVGNYVWDAGTLTWVAQTASSGGGGGPSSDVNITNTSIAVTGPLTDTQLRASAVPVSGTFWQATQPVSIASMPTTPVTGTFWQATQPVSAASLPLPSGAATQTTLASINTKTPSLGQAVMASSVPVVLASNQSALAVTGTFWQATQPVSGTFWQATQPVSIASMPTTPVTGTFWQATQPVSIASMPTTPVTKTKVALTASSPATASVGTSSASAVASNASRKGLVLTNLSANTISFGIGATAVLNNGITLTPNGVWVMDDYTFTTAAINAIASAASSTLAIQELT